MRQVRQLTAGAALAAAILVSAAAPATASCAGPVLTPSDTTVQAGQTITVTGRYWAAECNDTGGSEQSPPDTVHLSFVQRGQRDPLTTITARSDYTFRVEVTIPRDATEGPARVEGRGEASGAWSAGVTVVPPSAQVPDSLPFTGPRTDVAAMALVGVVCVAIGWPLVRLRRR